MPKSTTKQILFETDSVDDEMFMSSDLRIKKTFKNGLQFEHERQGGSVEVFTLYHGGVAELASFLNKWLEENK